MRDDERTSDHNHPDEEEDRFDDALDDLFGPDDDDGEIRPEPSQQRPQPPGGSTPPPHSYEPDVEHHSADAGHVFGPDNEPPPPSYDTFEQASEPQSVETTISVAPAKAGRDWRKIACFGCLGLVSIPALCLGILVVIGIVAGDTTDGTPTVGGVFIDSTPTPDPNRQLGLPDSPIDIDTITERQEPYSTVMDGRDPLSIELDGQVGIGRLNSPVPLETAAPLGDGWLLRIDSVTPDANQIVLDANMFNEPPDAGRQFVLAQVTVTNDTGEPGTFDASFRLRLIGAVTGSIYTTFEDADRCGVTPAAYEDLEIGPGESASGNVCWQVRVEDVNNLVLYSENFSADEGAIWFTLTLTGLPS